MSVMCDRVISVVSMYTNKIVMCDRMLSVASMYTNESDRGI